MGRSTVPALMLPTLSIVTPSFRQLDWLKLCAASIADQPGVQAEHLVQDAGTGAEMQQWAAEWKARCEKGDGKFAFHLTMERDDGMYDAVNRGLRRATGEVLAYLNCDEQYLPGALERVAQFFEENPTVDLAFGHSLVVDPNGKFIAFRKAILPEKIHTWVSRNLAILTCSTFFRRRVLDEHGLFFDTKFKDLGDGNWVMRALDLRLHMGVLPFFTSSFAESGENRNMAPTALREKDAMVASAPAWARALRPGIIAHYRLRKWWHGAYRQAPFDYAIYTARSPQERVTFHVAQPSYRWR